MGSEDATVQIAEEVQALVILRGDRPPPGVVGKRGAAIDVWCLNADA